MGYRPQFDTVHSMTTTHNLAVDAFEFVLHRILAPSSTPYFEWTRWRYLFPLQLMLVLVIGARVLPFALRKPLPGLRSRREPTELDNPAAFASPRRPQAIVQFSSRDGRRPAAATAGTAGHAGGKLLRPFESEKQ